MINLQNKKTIFLSLVFFVIDRISKFLVINHNNILEEKILYESRFLNIELVWNDGVAFGLLASSSMYFYNLISGLIFFIIVVLLFFIIKSKGLEQLFYVMIFSGALGNFYDRIVFRSVPDFIDLHVNNMHWFTFNFADVLITLGVLCLIFREFSQRHD